MYTALLRAINLGPHNKVSMLDLRRFFEDLGFHSVTTLLQSGNVVFEGGQSGAELEGLLERASGERLGLRTDYLVRDGAELQALVDANPFVDEAGRDPGHLVVYFLKAAPAAGALEALQGAVVGRERVGLAGKHLYAVYPDGIGRSKLTTGVIERKLGVRGTGRNWNTVLKLRELTAAAR